MSNKEKINAILNDSDIISIGGISVEDLSLKLEISEKEAKEVIKELKKANEIIAIPEKKHGSWRLKYHKNILNEETFTERIEEIFQEIGIPPWVKVTFFRGSKIAFIGVFSEDPGFTIIDYNQVPILIFHDRLAGGKSGEIIDVKKHSRYRCSENGIVKEYSYNGIIKK
jgi:hypothetical protein